MAQSLGALAGLAERLRSDPTVHVFATVQERFRDVHMKDLVADDLTEQRAIRIDGHTVVNFGSDSFLGLDCDPRVQRAIADGARRWGSHNGCSRAFCSVSVCEEAERRLAAWLGVEDTLIYPSVTLANMGALPAVLRRDDLLVIDRQAHDSMHEASKIALGNGVVVEQLPSCSPDALRRLLESQPQRDVLLAVDGVYSMTGEVPPLPELGRVAREFGGALYIDDAHGTGVIGPHGRGAAFRTLGHLRDVVCVGSLSKAFSCLGAYVTCSHDLKLLLKMRSSTYIFGGPVPPPYLEAIVVVCDILESPEYEQIAGRLRERVDRLLDGLRALDIAALGGDSPIISIPVGDVAETFLAGKWLFEHGFYVQSVTFPAVALQDALLRIQVNANHPLEAIDGLLNGLNDLKQVVRMPRAAEAARFSVRERSSHEAARAAAHVRAVRDARVQPSGSRTDGKHTAKHNHTPQPDPARIDSSEPRRTDRVDFG